MPINTSHQPLNLREERDFGQKINATFAFIAQNFRPLLRAVLLIAGPPILLSGILYGTVQGAFLSVSSYQDLWLANGLSSVAVVAFIIFALLGSVMLMLTVYAYMVAYMDLGNQKPAFADVWEIVKYHLASSVFYALGYGIMVIVACFFFLLPGIYLGVVMSMVFIIKLREEADFVEVIERSFYLIKGKWWSTFGLIFVVGLIQSIGTIAFQSPLFFARIASMLQLDFFNNGIYLTAASAVYMLGVSLMNVLVLVALGMQYFNLVERREGIGYIEQINKIGQHLNGAHEA